MWQSVLIVNTFKVENLKFGGLTKMVKVKTWKSEAINMDFVVGLPNTRRWYDSIWVIGHTMTNSSHFIPVKSTNKKENYAKLYID